VLALAGLGCGAEEHANDPRPAPPVRVSVALQDDQLTVEPSRIGLGPERTKLIPQNEDQPQPAIRTKAPLTVVFVSANLTQKESKLEISGPKETTSGLLVANGNGSYQTALPTGRYEITASGHPDAGSATLFVGPFRASSQNDVLLP
jgi:hypothetical protein